MQDIAADDRKWQPHAHVKKNGDVDFAHIKVDNQHKTTVNDWFATNVKVGDRPWDDF